MLMYCIFGEDTHNYTYYIPFPLAKITEITVTKNLQKTKFKAKYKNVKLELIIAMVSTPSFPSILLGEPFSPILSFLGNSHLSN